MRQYCIGGLTESAKHAKDKALQNLFSYINFRLWKLTFKSNNQSASHFVHGILSSVHKSFCYEIYCRLFV